MNPDEKITPEQQAILDKLQAIAARLEAAAVKRGWISANAGTMTLGVVAVILLMVGSLWFRTPTPAPTPPPKPTPAQTLLPESVEGSVGRMFKLTADSASPVVWSVPPESFVAADIHISGNDVIVTPLIQGTFSIGAALAGGKPAWCTVKCGTRPQPPPIPPGPQPPVPPAPIPLAGFRVLIVYDPASLTADQQGIVFGRKVRDYLQAKCVIGADGKTKEARIYQTGVDVSGEAKWIGDAMQKHPGQKSFMLASDGKTGFDGELPANANDALAILTKIGGQP